MGILFPRFRSPLSSESICCWFNHLLVKLQSNRSRELSPTLLNVKTTVQGNTTTNQGAAGMFQTPEGQSSRRTGTPNAPGPLARLENGSRFLEALPERERVLEFNRLPARPATRDEDTQNVFVGLDKSLPPSPSSNSPRRRTAWPQAPPTEAAPLVPAIPYHILADNSPSPKVFPQDPNIRAGEVHLGTGLVPIAQAQAYREAQRAEYLRTHPDVEAPRPESRPGLKRLASALRDGAKGLSRAASKRTVAQQPASPALAAPAAPNQAPPAAPRPIRRKMVGHEDRNTRFSDFLNLEPSPESSSSESLDGESPREEAEPTTPPPPPVPPRSQHRIPRKPIAARRHAPTPAPINPRLCPCPECTQERSGRRAEEKHHDMDHEHEQERREATPDNSERFETYSPHRAGPFDEDERTPVASHQAPSLVYDQFSPSSGPYHNPAFSASANDEVNRLLDLDWREKRDTTIVDTRVHDSHTSFLVTKFKDGSEVESHHYRQPLSPEMVEVQRSAARELSEDEDGAMAVWRRMEAETGGVVSPGSRTLSTVRQAQKSEEAEQVRTVGDFARGLRDEESSSEDAEGDDWENWDAGLDVL